MVGCFRSRRSARATAEEGGEVNASTSFAEDILAGAGATIMGRNMFGGGPGPWDESWQGWWGDDPPFHHPVFVLTSHPRESLELQGGTTFHFVTDGIGSALERARAAAARRRSLSGAGRRWRSNTSPRVCSTRSSFRSFRSCSEAALGCSNTSEREARAGRSGGARCVGSPRIRKAAALRRRRA